jgi:glutamate/tyrosine decarboxylase-like PLP-dependent enzyme
MFWKAMSAAEYQAAVQRALSHNVRYSFAQVLGFPGSFLDRLIFPDDPLLRERALLACVRENPNHIGCHTLTESETAFAGTQALEVDLIRLCAEEIAGATPGGYDGYVATGGTECNIEALWIQRNAFATINGLGPAELAIVCSEDTHYSVHKAGNLLGLDLLVIPVDETRRHIDPSALRQSLSQARASGKRGFLCVLNMGTTMFGSVDDIDSFTALLDDHGAPYRVHIDAAFGGFVYPFTTPQHRLDFRNPRVESMTMDAHKMLQAPYGTGIFLARKGLMKHVCTEAAAYVHGKDYTLCGSRSGANAVAVWMILQAYGSEGGTEFVRSLLQRTDRLCEGLERLGVSYFREPGMNLVAMRAEHIPTELAAQFTLVPDNHEQTPKYWKAVVMDHVSEQMIDHFLSMLAAQQNSRD